MHLRRRSLAAAVVALASPPLAGCSAFVRGDGPGSDDSPAGSRGAADVHVHNLSTARTELGVRVRRAGPSDDELVVDETFSLDVGDSERVNNELLFDAEYEVTVIADGTRLETASWTASSGGGLHVLYDGTENVVFADAFA